MYHIRKKLFFFIPKIILLISLFLILPSDVSANTTCSFNLGFGSGKKVTLLEDVISSSEAENYTLHFQLDREGLDTLRDADAYIESLGAILGPASRGARTSGVKINDLDISIPVNKDTIIGEVSDFTSGGQHKIEFRTTKGVQCAFSYLIINNTPVSQPVLTITPTSFKKEEAPEFIDARIDAGTQVAESYKIFLGVVDRVDQELGKEMFSVRCLDKKDCSYSDVGIGGTVDNVKITKEGDHTIISFQIRTASLDPNQWTVSLREDISINSDKKKSFDPVSAAFTILAKDAANPLKMQIVSPEGAQIDVSKTSRATIKVKVTGPETRDYKIEFRTNISSTIDPATPILSCRVTEPDKCVGEFKLPNEGLSPGDYSIKLLNKDDSKLRAEEVLHVGGDAATRPGTVAVICKDDPKKCVTASPNMCDITTGTLYDTDPNTPKFRIPDEKTGFMTALGCIPTHPIALINGFLRFFAGASGGIALLMMIYGAYQMITSQGSADALKKGQEQFTAAVIGILFVIFAVTILQIIGVDILNLPGFKK